jgi:hypothetical protein
VTNHFNLISDFYDLVSTYVYYDLSQQTSEGGSSTDHHDAEGPIASAAPLNLLYHKFWKHRHNIKKFFIGLEDYPHEFTNFFFTMGLNELTLDQLLGLIDIPLHLGANIITETLDSDPLVISATPPSPVPPRAIATLLMGHQAVSNGYRCFVYGRSHARKGRLEGCINTFRRVAL